MLSALRGRLGGLIINSSRHHLEEWAKQAGAVGSTPDFRVLDVGAGVAPYRQHFSRVTYETADLAQTDKEYGRLDHVCDVTDMPMPDDTYDLVFCSQTLEHVREPVKALEEIGRVLKPGGQAWLSAPLFFEEHEKPYDFFRYTQFAWRDMAERAGLEVRSIDWMEGYFGTVSYQLQMAAKDLPVSAPTRAVFLLLSRRYARKDMRRRYVERGMPKNYQVVAIKPAPSGVPG